MKPLADAILQRLSTSTDTPCVRLVGTANTTSWSRLEFSQAIERSVAQFEAFPRHTCIALAAPTSPETLARYVAALKVAQHTMLFDPAWPPQTREQIESLLAPDLVVTDRGISESQRAVANRDQHHNAPDTANLPPALTHAMLTCFSSGSTQLPKGCCRSQASWMASFQLDQPWLDFGESLAVPIFGHFANSLYLYTALKALQTGASLLFPQSHHSHTLRQLVDSAASGPQVWVATPVQLATLVELCSAHSPEVATIVSCGSPLPASLSEAIRLHLPGARLVEMYGSAELSFIAGRDVQVDEPDSLVGEPLPGVSVDIVDECQTSLAVGTTGHLAIASPLACSALLGTDGLLEPQQPLIIGDLGYCDAQGRLHVVGRSARQFLAAGRTVVPETIEAALQAIDGIEQATVCGLPDDKRGNRIAAAVRTSRPMDRRTVLGGLADALPDYQHPTRLFRLQNNWPQTPAGKTDVRQLNELMASGKLEPL